MPSVHASTLRGKSIRGDSAKQETAPRPHGSRERAREVASSTGLCPPFDTRLPSALAMAGVGCEDFQERRGMSARRASRTGEGAAACRLHCEDPSKRAVTCMQARERFKLGGRSAAQAFIRCAAIRSFPRDCSSSIASARDSRSLPGASAIIGMSAANDSCASAEFLRARSRDRRGRGGFVFASARSRRREELNLVRDVRLVLLEGDRARGGTASACRLEETPRVVERDERESDARPVR